MFTIRLGKRASELCLAVKRQTGLQHMNEVCRLAYFYSLAFQNDGGEYRDEYGGIDIEWDVFAGSHASIIKACTARDLGAAMPTEKLIRERVVIRISIGLIALNRVGDTTSIAGALVEVKQ